MTIGQDYIYQLGWNYGGENGPDQQRFQQAMETLDQMVYHLIEKRRRSGRQENDLLSMLLQVQDEETHEGMDDRQLRDEIVGIFGAGRDTTAIALAWTWYLLATHPEAEHRLQAELSTVLQGRLPTVADLPQLIYTRQIVEEALRLYPPGWMTARMSLGEDEIDGYHIPAQAEIFLSPYITQRHPAFWTNPEQFEPGRFAPEQSVSRPKFAYFPFGGGPRVCIGSAFAMVELQLVVATIAQAYRRRLAPGAKVEMDVRMTLQPQGLQLILER
jgi:cytochrome P450